jgi:hypothetical protein
MDGKKSPFENLKSSELFSEKIDGFVFGAVLKDGQVGMMVNGKFDLTDRLMMIIGFFQSMLGIDLPRWPLKLESDEQKFAYLKLVRQAFSMVGEMIDDKEKFMEFWNAKGKQMVDDEEKKDETDQVKKTDA